jgi:hypothetical protein
MALQADCYKGLNGAYIKVIEADKRTKGDPAETYVVYEVAIYPDESTRRADTTDDFEQRSRNRHVDRFKIKEYTGTDPIADAYNHLKTQTDRVSNTVDV